MKHSVPHDLTRDEAKKAAQAAWENYSTRFSEYSPSCNWPNEYVADIGFRVKGVSLSGSLDVGESEIALELDVPFLLRPFKGSALRVIEDEIRVWVKKAKEGQL